MNRQGLWGGLLCYLPVALWLAPQLEPDPDTAPLLAWALAGLWTAQGLTLALLAPGWGRQGGRVEALNAVALVVILPLPLVVAGWLGDGVGGIRAGLTLAGLAGWGVALAEAGRLARPALSPLLPLVAALALWAGRHGWLP